jgi:hypothetical protein
MIDLSHYDYTTVSANSFIRATPSKPSRKTATSLFLGEHAPFRPYFNVGVDSLTPHDIDGISVLS